MGKSPYKIQFGGLPIGIHEYEFEIKEAFFKDIENSEIEKANIVVNAILTKQNNLLTVNFEINGTVGIACDRCLADFDFEIESDVELSSKQAINLYRILQEIVNNAIKHADAKDIFVAISQVENALQIKIQDNGVGFDYESKKKKSFGLSKYKSL